MTKELKWSSNVPTEESAKYLFRTNRQDWESEFGIAWIYLHSPGGKLLIQISSGGLCETITTKQWKKRKYQTIGPIP